MTHDIGDVRDIWAGLLSDEELEVIERGGYGKRRGLGDSPAVVVIDCQYNHIGADAPIRDQLDEWPAGAGHAGWRVVRTTKKLLDVARQYSIPVIYTRYCYSEMGARFDAFGKKRGRSLNAFVAGSPGTEIVAEISPQCNDLVIDKVHASAFFGTALISYVIQMKVDTLLITGVSTSGCVRATAIDAVSMNFNVAVVADGVGDRIDSSHRSSLLDLWMKYTDVVYSDEVVEYLRTIGARNGVRAAR